MCGTVKKGKVTVAVRDNTVWIEYWRDGEDTPYRSVRQFSGTPEACHDYVAWLERSRLEHERRWNKA